MIDPVNLRLALLSAAVLGFRHGLDYDHIAAITDISSVQAKARDAMKYGLLYVMGHATTVAVLGTAAVVFRIALPPASDRWAERLVGITLLVLGLYVLGTFLRPSTHSHARPRTRITLLINGGTLDLLAAEPALRGHPSRGSAGIQRRIWGEVDLSGGSNPWARRGNADANPTVFDGGEPRGNRRGTPGTVSCLSWV